MTDIQGANAYHVVKISTVSDTAVLDGFTISAGCGSTGRRRLRIVAGRRESHNNGGRPTLGATWSFRAAQLTWAGGVFNVDGHPTLTNILFRGNTATLGGGMYNAGARLLRRPTSPLTGNSASERGGALSNAGVDTEKSNRLFPLLTNVTLVANSAGGYGGAIRKRFQSPGVRQTASCGAIRQTRSIITSSITPTSA